MDTVSPPVFLSHRRAAGILAWVVLASFALALLASVAIGSTVDVPPPTPEHHLVAPFRWMVVSPRLA